MNIDEININNNQLISLEYINKLEFYKIIETIQNSLTKIGIDTEGMKVYYQREIDATSILAIQVSKGSYKDINNYMITGCKTHYHGIDAECDIYMHSKSKSAQKSSELAFLITKDIVDFFEKIENELLRENNFYLPLAIMIPLDKEIIKEENNIKKLLKKILNK